MSFAARLARVRDRLEAACARAGRDADTVTLIAVTKYATLDQVREALAAGVRDLGENRPQQLTERAALLGGELDDQSPGVAAAVRWHQIGQLQRNKVRKVLPAAALTHSIDSAKLLATIDRIAAEAGSTADVLLQVNVSGEDRKSGFTPDGARELWAAGIDRFGAVRVRGLMTLAPLSDDPEQARPTFAALRGLRDELAGGDPAALPFLSMGMSGDFEVAVAEGATHVRLGGALFGGR